MPAHRGRRGWKTRPPALKAMGVGVKNLIDLDLYRAVEFYLKPVPHGGDGVNAGIGDQFRVFSG
ncbi:hypothetical protein NXT3_PA00158 (plasmid) [Sinorhizobium fredii]|uniref:Uncharacterized protein n=1 Tax=Rhizobium fredii TaxID=380 RepID=A0A2L0HAC2_RHIFR|nr:hypothetical protein NXT3_PA00158 [Sinorhizobium fredii]